MLNMLDALALKLVCEEKTRRKEANKEVVVLRFCLSHLVFSNFFSFVKILLERFSVRSNELRFEVVNDMGGEGYSASIKDIEKIKSIGVDVRLCN
ncbi:hypothetical protein AUC60_21410 [Pseudomonas caspiana]|uniref:EAL domain-containing protein n=2 Tax=Pseudomonas caspiana TaxID=1451454 RepID=A0A1Y3P2Y1_9PSED|nr:hypothetical protein AUC60_21410 [Pseudomonas caspiana]